MNPGATRYSWWDDNGIEGICCYCGYAGEEETACDVSPDKTHCVHWWDGKEKTE